MALLEVQGVSKSFGGVHALRDVSFSVTEGSITGLIGPNGSGKSTMFNLVSGLARADQGTIRFAGTDITKAAPTQIAHMGVGRAFQIVRPLGGLNCVDNLLPGLLYGQRGFSIKDARREALSILTLLRLDHKANVLASDLSLWEKKSLEVARSLSLSPRLLLLDEVFAGLVPGDVDRTVEAVRGIQEERKLTVLLVEHVMRATMALCDEIVVLSYGEVLATGEPDEIVRNPEVIRVYLGAAGA